MEFASPPRLPSQLRTRQNWAEEAGGGRRLAPPPQGPGAGSGGGETGRPAEGRGGLHRAVRLGRVFKRASSWVPLPTLPRQEGAGLPKLRVRGVSRCAPPYRRSLGATQPLTTREAPTPSVGSFVVLEHRRWWPWAPVARGFQCYVPGSPRPHSVGACQWGGPRMNPASSPKGPPVRGRGQHLHRGPVGCWVPPNRVLSNQVSSIHMKSCYRAVGAPAAGLPGPGEDWLFLGASRNGGHWAGRHTATLGPAFL